VNITHVKKLVEYSFALFQPRDLNGYNIPLSENWPSTFAQKKATTVVQEFKCEKMRHKQTVKIETVHTSI
jgi:hypothetical protein